MLYLAPPFQIIDGISIFRDHEDELQYYYMPLYPHLTTVKDSITGIGTLTYIDPNTKIFGALGHEIADSTTKEILDINEKDL